MSKSYILSRMDWAKAYRDYEALKVGNVTADDINALAFPAQVAEDMKNLTEGISDDVFNELVDNAKLNWINPVDSYGELPTDAEKGDTVMTRDNGYVYRFDGEQWIEIQEIDVGPVNELDSRLSQQLDSTNQQLAETATKESLSETKSASFLSNVVSAPRLRSGYERKIISHFNGAFIAASSNVTVTQPSPNKMTISTPGENSYVVRISASRNSGDVPFNYVDLVISALKWSAFTGLTLRLIPDKSSPSDYYSRQFNRTLQPFIVDSVPNNVSRLFRLAKADFVKTGAPSIFGLTENGEIHITVQTSEATSITLYDGIMSSEPLAPVMIMFDDGDLGVYEHAFPIMRERGIPGTFFVITDRMSNAAGHCTWEQLHEMQEAGWTIANHTSDHSNLMEVSLDHAIAVVEKGAGALAKRGFRGASYLAAPFNALDSSRQSYMSHTIRSLRLGADGVGNYRNPLQTKNFPGTIRARSIINTDTPSYVFNNDYLPAKNNGLLCALNYHVINSSGSSQFTYKYDLLAETLDMLIADGAVFVNYEEYCNAYLTVNEDAPGFTS